MSKDIFLVVADTLTAFHLPFYGHERDTAPFLTELAEENILFKQAYAPAPWTVPVHASMFTGEMPDVCGTNADSLVFDSYSIAEELGEEGYRTVGLSNNYLVNKTLNFDRGFEYFESNHGIHLESGGFESLKKVFEREQEGEYESKKEKYLDFLKESVINLDYRSLLEGLRYYLLKKDSQGFFEDRGARDTNNIIRKELDGTEDDLFLFVNYMEPHQPFNLPEGEHEFLDNPEEETRRYQEEVWDKDLDGKEVEEDLIRISKDFYDSSILYLDSRIEELYEMAESHSDDFIFIVLGDHGEMLGDMNKWGHQGGIWEELVRVPMIVAGPDIESETTSEYFSLRKVYNIIKGENPLDLVEEKVFAQYKGAHGFAERFGSGHKDEELDKYYYNKSNAVVEDGKLIVENTELENLEYNIRDNSKGDVKKEVKVPKSIKIRFGSGLDDLEF